MKEIRKNKLSLSALILSALWLFLYFALGAAIFKNMWYTSPAIPICGGLVAVAPTVLQVANIYINKNRKLEIALVCICPALMLAHFLFFAFVLSKLTYFFIAGKPYFITLGIAALVLFFVFAFPRLSKICKRISAIAVSAVLFIICLFGVFGAVPFYVSAGATVFAVDGEYQIAFATSHKSTGAVTVDGVTYCDQTNGEKNISRLHKISVPAERLDLARTYTIETQGVALNTAYLPSKGAKIKRSYDFRPADENDGLQIYNLSDTHECISGPAKAASYFGEKLDLLILNGDIINDVSSEYQISLIYKLANRITGGSHPVIFARGNHECNGYLAADFGKYVGCADRGFYYRYKIGTTLSLLVLDTACDMADDNPLISPIANFDEMRKAQTEWMKEQSGWDDCEFNFVIAHMAYPLSGYQAESCSWSDWAQELVELTNLDADFAICGHSHKTDVTLSDTWDNAVANYPVVRGSIRSNKYPDKEGVSPFEFTGTAIEIKDGNLSFKFTNAKKQVLETHTFKD